MQWNTPTLLIIFFFESTSSSNISGSLPKIYGSSSQNGLTFLTINPSSYSCSLFFIWIVVILSLLRISVIILILIYHKHFQNFHGDWVFFPSLTQGSLPKYKYLGHRFLYVVLHQYQQENKLLCTSSPKSILFPWEMGPGRHNACQGANIVLNLGDNTGGPGDLLGRMFDSSDSVEAKGLGVREPVH